MKVYRVVSERDGETAKVGGTSSTEIKRMEFHYAAETMDQVWDAIEYIRNDPEQTLIAIIEEHPGITVIGGKND